MVFMSLFFPTVVFRYHSAFLPASSPSVRIGSDSQLVVDSAAVWLVFVLTSLW